MKKPILSLRIFLLSICIIITLGAFLLVIGILLGGIILGFGVIIGLYGIDKIGNAELKN
jgi:hypothetical protein